MRFTFFILIVLTSFSFSSAPDFADELSLRLQRYYKGRYEHQLYFTFHQSKYIAGDTAFFKGYLLRKTNLAMESGKHLVNLQLIDENNNEKRYERILFNNGFGQGYIVLNNKLEEGCHTLKAYSDEMVANGDTSSFLNQPFYITGKERVLQSKEVIEFKFEGGRLIEGLKNRGVIQSTPLTLIKITDALNTMDTSFISSSTGVTLFTFTPKKNSNYSVTVGNVKKAIPTATPKGMAMMLDRNNELEQFSVTIRNSKDVNGVAYAIVTSGEKVSWSRSFQLSESTLFTIPYRSIEPGLNRLTIFSSEGEVFGERLFYVPAAQATVTSAVQEEETNTRNNISLSLQLKNATSQWLNGRVSVSVSKDEFFMLDSASKVVDIHKEIIAQSINSKKFEALTDFEKSEVGFDNYLILHYKEHIPWRTILSGGYQPYLRITPYYLKGRAVYETSGLPLPDSTFITFYLNGHENIFGRHTKNGNFEFPMYMNFSDDQLFYKAEFKAKTLTGIKIIADTSGLATASPACPSLTMTNQADPYFKFGSIKRTAEESFNFYRNAKINTVSIQETPGDWKSDFYVDLKKLKTFATISEIFHEAVPMVQVRKKNEQNIVRVFLKHLATYASENPVYIIDGIMTDDTEYFLSLAPEKISIVKIIRSKENLTHFGVLGKNGVVIIQSKTGEYGDKAALSQNSIQVKGIQEPRAFSIPNYANESGKAAFRHEPDLRAVLYWNPDVIIKNGKAQVSFTTSDLTGSFTIKIEGVTESDDFVGDTKSLLVSFTKQ